MKKFKRDAEMVVSVVLCVLFLSGQVCFAFDEYMAGPPNYVMEAAPPEYQGYSLEPYAGVVEARNAIEAELGLEIVGSVEQTSQVVEPPITETLINPEILTPPATPPADEALVPTAPLETIASPPEPVPADDPIPPTDLWSLPPVPDPVAADDPMYGLVPLPPAGYWSLPPFPNPVPPEPPAVPSCIIDFPGIPAVSMPPMTFSVYFEVDGIHVYYDVWTLGSVTDSWIRTTYEYFFPYPPPAQNHITPTIIDTDSDGIPDSYEIPPDIG